MKINIVHQQNRAELLKELNQISENITEVSCDGISKMPFRQVIALLLHLPKHVTSIDLSNSTLGDMPYEEIVGFFRAIRSNIMTVSLAGNNLDKLPIEELKVVLNALPHHITSLDLTENGLSESNLALLVKGLAPDFPLIAVRIGNNKVIYTRETARHSFISNIWITVQRNVSSAVNFVRENIAKKEKKSEQMPETLIRKLSSAGFKTDSKTHAWIFDKLIKTSKLGSYKILNAFFYLALRERAGLFFNQPEHIVYLNKRIAATDLAKIIFDVDGKVDEALIDAIQYAIEKSLVQEGPLPACPLTNEINELLNERTEERINILGELEFRKKDEESWKNAHLLFRHAELTQLQYEGNCSEKEEKSACEKLPWSLRYDVEEYTGPDHFKLTDFLYGKGNGKINTTAFQFNCALTMAMNQLPLLMDTKVDGCNLFEKEKGILQKIQIAAVSDQRQCLASALSFLDQIHTATQYNDLLTQSLKRKIITQVEHDFLINKFYSLRPLLGYRMLCRQVEPEETAAVEMTGILHSRLPSVSSTSWNLHGVMGRFINIYYKAPRLPGISEISEHDDEDEVLLPAGLRVCFEKMSGTASDYLATIESSPSFENAYWPEHALRHIHIWNSRIKNNSIDNARSFSQAQRVILYIPLLVNYLAAHGHESSVRLFCKNLMPADITWLKVIAIFFAARGVFEKPTEAFNAYIAQEKLEQKLPPRVLASSPVGLLFSATRGITDKLPGGLDIVRNILLAALAIDHAVSNMENKHLKEWVQNYRVLNCKKGEEQQEDFLKIVRYAVQLVCMHGENFENIVNEKNDIVKNTGCKGKYNFFSPKTIIKQTPFVRMPFIWPKSPDSHQNRQDDQKEHHSTQNYPKPW